MSVHRLTGVDVTHAIGRPLAASGEADEIRMLQPGFSSRGWLATDPMSDVTQKTKSCRR
jgi:hypothetical protein